MLSHFTDGNFYQKHPLRVEWAERTMQARTQKVLLLPVERVHQRTCTVTLKLSTLDGIVGRCHANDTDIQLRRSHRCVFYDASHRLYRFIASLPFRGRIFLG